MQQQHPHNLFVYGTLKRGFYNHNVYLSQAVARQTAIYLGTAVTQRRQQQQKQSDDAFLQLEVRGPRHVPVLFLKHCHNNNNNNKQNHHVGTTRSSVPPQVIRGEVYCITGRVLQAMDLLEGVATGFYYRTQTGVALHSSDKKEEQDDDSVAVEEKCWVYLQKSLPNDDNDNTEHPTYAEYTPELHTRYVPPTAEPNPEILKLVQT